MRLVAGPWPLAAVLLGLAVPGAASAISPAAITPAITEYTTGMPAGSAPHGMTLGSDGNVWFADHGIPTAEAVGFITPAGSITRYTAGISNSAGVEDVVDGPGGVWFSEFQRGGLGVVTPGGTITELGGLSFGGLGGITPGPDGNVWVTETGGSDGIGQVTPSSFVSEFQAGLSGGAHPQDIVTGPDGNLWFTEPGTASIGRVTPFGVITEYGTAITGSPQEIAAGPDGNLWFTQTGPAAIGRVTTLGAVTEFTAGLPGSSAPQAITPGADGNLYFTDNGANAIGQVTPSGTITEFSAGLTANADLKGITTGADGAVWFAQHIGAIGRMTVGPTAGATTPHSLTDTTVTLHGDVRDNGAATYSFDWGTTTAYGHQAPGTSIGAGNTHQASATLTGLAPATTYHARVVVTTATGTARGTDVAFTTADAPSVTMPATDTSTASASDPASGADGAPAGDAAPPSAAPRPVMGSTVVSGVTSGTVLIGVPGGKRHKLGRTGRIRTGSVLDARHGRVRITSALDAAGHTQSATFWGGVFVVRQPRGGHGRVDLVLQGTPQGCGRAVARSARRRQPIKLWGKDHGGRYRTIGNSSVATVRGTEWLVMETCMGTVTRVVEGSVSVWDRTLHKRVLLTAKPRAATYTARR